MNLSPQRPVAGNPKGFTLLEVVFSTGLLVVTTLLMANLATHSTKDSADDERRARAIQLASNQMEDLLRRYATDPLLSAGSHSASFDIHGKSISPPGFFTLEWTITPDTPIPSILHIQESVLWKTEKVSHHVDLQSNRGAQ
jgi:type II secretory pathway pseudopilin PulG